MAHSAPRDTLSRVRVGQAMRRQVIYRQEDATIGSAINALIKYKVSGCLIVDVQGKPAGVVSKTDIMGAYYAGIPIRAPLETIMNGPPLFCSPNMSLSRALEIMRDKRVYRLFVRTDEDAPVEGLLAYPDIIGLLYRVCRHCDFSLRRRPAADLVEEIVRYRVSEVMTSGVRCLPQDTPLYGVVETLAAHRFGALLLTDAAGVPQGVVSKTDLAMAYRRGVSPQSPARDVMSPSVFGCPSNATLEDAIRRMIFSDVHRLFVYEDREENIVGVLSLSDAARVRSGSCHACVTSRIRV